MKVIFAGGGTGGHLYPAIAMARELQGRDPESRILFVGTGEGLEVRVLPKEGFELKTLRVMGVKGKKGWEQVQALLALPGAFLDSLSVLRSFQPDAVVGVGGFASGPLVLAAVLTRRKTMLQEQNSVPGVTNRILGKRVDRIYTAYAESHCYFPAGRVLQTGNPIRKGIGGKDRGEAVRHFGLDPDRKTVLVLGGSRGAHAINVMVADMVGGRSWSGAGVQFLHQTGKDDAAFVSDKYHSAGVPAVVKPYIRDVALAYGAADLAVSRAGAVALSELCAAGVPQLLIPFPYAADDHQLRNARVVEGAGAAEVWVQAELTPERLGERIRTLLQDADGQSAMREAALRHGRPDASKAIVDDMEKVLQRKVATGGENDNSYRD